MGLGAKGEGRGERDERGAGARWPVGPDAPGWLERAEWFFTFLAFFAGFFYLTREAKTDLQWYFRVTSIFVGVLGWMVVQVLKRRRG